MPCLTTSLLRSPALVVAPCSSSKSQIMAYYLLTVLEQDGGVEVQRLVKDLVRSRVSKIASSTLKIDLAFLQPFLFASVSLVPNMSASSRTE